MLLVSQRLLLDPEQALVKIRFLDQDLPLLINPAPSLAVEIRVADCFPVLSQTFLQKME